MLCVTCYRRHSHARTYSLSRMSVAQSSRGVCSRLIALTSGTVADRVCPAFPTIIEDRRYGTGLEEHGSQTLTVHALTVPSVVYRLGKCCGLLETITDNLHVRGAGFSQMEHTTGRRFLSCANRCSSSTCNRGRRSLGSYLLPMCVCVCVLGDGIRCSYRCSNASPLRARRRE